LEAAYLSRLLLRLRLEAGDTILRDTAQSTRLETLLRLGRETAKSGSCKARLETLLLGLLIEARGLLLHGHLRQLLLWERVVGLKASLLRHLLRYLLWRAVECAWLGLYLLLLDLRRDWLLY